MLEDGSKAASALQERLGHALVDGLKEVQCMAGRSPLRSKVEIMHPSLHEGAFLCDQVIANLLHLVVKLALFQTTSSERPVTNELGVQCGPAVSAVFVDADVQASMGQPSADIPCEIAMVADPETRACVDSGRCRETKTQTAQFKDQCDSQAVQTDGVWMQCATAGVRIGGGFHVFRTIDQTETAPSWSEVMMPRADPGRSTAAGSLARARSAGSLSEGAGSARCSASAGLACGSPMRAALASRVDREAAWVESPVPATPGELAQPAPEPAPSVCSLREHAGATIAYVDQLLAGEASRAPSKAAQADARASSTLRGVPGPEFRGKEPCLSPHQIEHVENVELARSLKFDLSKQLRPSKPKRGASTQPRSRPGSAQATRQRR